VKVSTDVLAVLDKAVISGHTLTLTGQLDPPMYKQVAKVIEMAGGKWNRKAKCHLFEQDASETLDPLMLTGEISDTKKDFGQFDTPAAVGRLAVLAANIRDGMKVLEPNAGKGALVTQIRAAGDVHLFGYEIDPHRHAYLMQSLFYPAGGCGLADLLTIEPAQTFDRVVMNPPFAGQADIKHVTHAMKFLKPDGRLVAIMSNGVAFRTNKATTDFRELMERHGGEITRLPEGAFKESGTGVNTVMVTMDARQ
jgi:type I restriction-modification system DNA methylase subunit